MMGMYTELIFGATLKSNTPEDVIDVIKDLINIDRDFSKGRSPLIGSSYYFGVSEFHSKFFFDDIAKSWVLSTRANIKNYGDEIEEFLEWIKPYIESGSGRRDFYAVVTYEESDEPTIYYLND